MRAFVFLLALAVALPLAAGQQAKNDRYLLLLNFLPALTTHLQPDQLEYAEENISVVRVPFADIEAWSTRVHEELGGCGGFFDVTEKIESGMSPQVLVWHELLRKQMPAPKHQFIVEGRPEIATLMNAADGEKLWEFLTELSALPDRSATTDNGGKATGFLADKALALASGGGVAGFSTQTVKTGGYEKQPSLVATMPGTDPSLPHVVIGGHMDTFSDNKPGADDDGSGTAIVMEALRAISASKAKFAHTIDFIWYAAEERGLVGSSYVVDQFKAQGIKVASAIQFDMVGYNASEDGEDIYVITDYTDAGLNQAMKDMIAKYLPHVKVGETRCGYPCSDHANWNRAGVPVVFPFEATFGNLNYKLHTSDDKITYLDKAHALNFAKLALVFLGEMAKLQ